MLFCRFSRALAIFFLITIVATALIDDTIDPEVYLISEETTLRYQNEDLKLFTSEELLDIDATKILRIPDQTTESEILEEAAFTHFDNTPKDLSMDKVDMKNERFPKNDSTNTIYLLLGMLIIIILVNSLNCLALQYFVEKKYYVNK